MAQRTFATAAATLLALVALAGCGSDGDGDEAGPVETDTVTVKDFQFTPQHIATSPGTTVTWRFEDGEPHSVVFDDGSFQSKEHGAGGSEGHAFTAPGEFTYKCGIHPSMTGSVHVES